MEKTIDPAWLSWMQATKYTGLCERTLRSAHSEGAFQSRMVILGGKQKGRRLINRASLDKWIWSQGEPQPEGTAA